MLTIKDFKKGDKVYIVKMNFGRNTDPDVRELEVEAVGRKYVTIGEDAWTRKFQNVELGLNPDPDYLHENVQYGEAALLFQTESAANDHIEKEKLKRWLSGISFPTVEKYTLDQLRAVKNILNPEKET